jgi:hypothetical protein
MLFSPRVRRVAFRGALPGLVCALAASCLAQASTSTVASSSAVASLEQCATAPAASERSATFAGEMTALPGTARMEIRIDVLERLPGEGQYRTVSAPGLGVWRDSSPGVKTYTSFNTVNDLSAPAFYRGAVRFRWLNAKGRAIKSEELRTPRCEQPAAPASAPTTSTPSGELLPAR